MACAFPRGESAIVLQAEANKEVDLPVGHIHDLLDRLLGRASIQPGALAAASSRKTITKQELLL